MSREGCVRGVYMRCGGCASGVRRGWEEKDEHA